MRAIRPALALVLAFAAVLAPSGPVLAQGCAMCSSALGGPQVPLARAIGWSVLFLMATPYLLVGTAGAWLFYMHRRGTGRRRAAVIHLARRAARLRRRAPRDQHGGDVP